MRRFHDEMPRHVSGAGFMFWVFHVIRDYARTLRRGRSRMARRLPALPDARRRAGGARRRALPIVFGHNDLLAGNFLDDGNRLWLIDFEYAGFSHGDVRSRRPRRPTPACRAERGRAAARRPISVRAPGAEIRRAHRRHAMRLAAARGDVEHGLGAASRRARRRLRRLHGRESRRGSTRRSPPIAATIRKEPDP